LSQSTVLSSINRTEEAVVLAGEGYFQNNRQWSCSVEQPCLSNAVVWSSV